MKDIISELYKKVLGFFNNEVKEENSKDTACNRLKLVLMQDRAKMEPALMEKMREEMINVISKYVEIDKEALDLNLEAEGESFALMLNIPVLRAKTREEVEEAEGIINDDDDDDDDDALDLEEENDEEEDDDEMVEENEIETIELIEDEDSLSENDEQKDEEDNQSKEISSEEENILTDENIEVRKKKTKHQKDDDL